MKKIIVKIDLNNKKYGGRIYENMVIDSIRDKYDIKRIFLMKYQIKILNLPWILWIYLKYHFIYRGLVIYTNQTTWIAGSRSKNLVIVHHLDTSTTKGISGIYQKICDKALIKNKQKFNIIVTVAKYWTQKLMGYGFDNIKLIYNSFNPNLYKFSEMEISDFKNRYNFDNRPIIYLGNCQKQKGVVEVYDTLKHLNFNFVTTGIKDVEIGARHLNLNFRDYRLLLSASSIVITMSKLIEGWNRTAHEALLSGTQVIGSGTGGMKELLQLGGGQFCDNINQLEAMVLKLMDKNEMCSSSKLDSLNLEYFRQEWDKTLDNFVRL